ncbi:hypothetical protein H4582DRAFT_2090839 [Lactarius indigo]|nr:hypothetical protein H4582DRAFT_2090839 [Lactarius indigo]
MPLENAQIVAPVAGLRRGWYFSPPRTARSARRTQAPPPSTPPGPPSPTSATRTSPRPPPRSPAVLVPVGTPTSLRALLSLAYLPLTPARNPLRFELTRTRLRTVQPGPHQLHRNVMQEASPLTQKQSIALPLPHAHNSRWTFPRCSILQLVPHPKPVFYSNCATCYVSMEPSQHEEAVADCDRHSYRR